MNFMGKDESDEKRFSNGIQKYIETYQYKNAEMIDLFNSLNEVIVFLLRKLTRKVNEIETAYNSHDNISYDII